MPSKRRKARRSVASSLGLATLGFYVLAVLFLYFSLSVLTSGCNHGEVNTNMPTSIINSTPTASAGTLVPEVQGIMILGIIGLTLTYLCVCCFVRGVRPTTSDVMRILPMLLVYILFIFSGWMLGCL